MAAVPLWRSLWPHRVLWAVLPVLAGPALADALADRSRSVQVVGSGLAWTVWAGVVVASLVPRSLTLTVVRLAVPGALAVASWAALDAARPVWGAVGVVAALFATLSLAAPGVSDGYVNGSSYGTERRVALRIPLVLVATVLPLAWAVAFAAAITGPLLLATRRWVPGTLALVGGAAVVAVVGRQMHLFARRWLVFVPAGIVVHDPFTLTEPILFPRTDLRRIGPAEADTDGLDVTGGATGLVIEIRPRDPIAVGVRTGRERVEHEGVAALLVTPTQPGTTLALAAEARLPVA